MGLLSMEKNSGEAESPSTPWATENTSSFSEALKAAKNSKRKQSSGPTTVRAESSGPDISPALSQQVAKLFTPEAWEAVVSAPFNLAEALTGLKEVNLNETERKTLSVTGSMTAEYFMPCDPKWVALTLFSFNLLMISGSKYMIYVAKQREEQALKEQATKNASLKSV